MNKYNWIIGCILSVLSTIFGAFSKLLIRKSWKLKNIIEKDLTLSDMEKNNLIRMSRMYYICYYIGMGILNPACELDPFPR